MNLIAGIRNNRKATSIVSRAIIVALLTVPTLVLTGASPALAAQNGVVTLGFAGSASLPQFPCDGCGATGTFSGTATGHGHGEDNGKVWEVQGITGTINASFTYNEPVATCPREGTANGSGSVDGAATGVYDITGTARIVTDVHVDFTFSWVRTGITATITTRATVALTFATDPFRVTVLANVVDTATAVFVAHDSDTDICNGSSITADVVGADLIAG